MSTVRAVAITRTPATTLEELLQARGRCAVSTHCRSSTTSTSVRLPENSATAVAMAANRSRPRSLGSGLGVVVRRELIDDVVGDSGEAIVDTRA